MALYVNVYDNAAGFSHKTGFFLDAFTLRPMPEDSFPQLRSFIRRSRGQREGVRGFIIRRPEGPTHPPSRGNEGVCPLGGGRDSGGG